MERKMERKIVVVNGSYRESQNTHKALRSEAKRLKEEYDIEKVVYFFLDDYMMACHHCTTCQLGCRFQDQFQEIANELKDAERILLGSPVYLDMPSAKMVAFLTRLCSYSESTNREFFRGKKAHFVSTAYCSGTKAVIHALMGACEMLGFTMEGRCSREYVLLWNDKKIRGGMRREDVCFLNEGDNEEK
jgi:multimeric flavodoxin WrbA